MHVRQMRISQRSSVVGLEAQSCVIPGHGVIVSLAPAPGHRPSRQLKQLARDISVCCLFGLFFHEPAPKNFWGFLNRRRKFLTVRCVACGCGSTLRPLESTWTAHWARRAFLTVKLLHFNSHLDSSNKPPDPGATSQGPAGGAYGLVCLPRGDVYLPLPSQGQARTVRRLRTAERATGDHAQGGT